VSLKWAHLTVLETGQNYTYRNGVMQMRAFNHPALIGFESIFNELSQAVDTPSYPPYNIAVLDDVTSMVEMAVTGVNKEDLFVTVQGKTLTVKGLPNNIHPFKKAEEQAIKYTHRGLSRKQFTREFTLSDDIEVDEVIHRNGMLYIKLVRVIPEESKVRNIEIK